MFKTIGFKNDMPWLQANYSHEQIKRIIDEQIYIRKKYEKEHNRPTMESYILRGLTPTSED